MSTPVGQADAILVAALDLPVAERAAYLDQARGDDAPLRQLVEALVRAYQFAPGPRGQPRPVSPAATLFEKPGDRIGPYKLLQQIGEGGCGVV